MRLAIESPDQNTLEQELSVVKDALTGRIAMNGVSRHLRIPLQGLESKLGCVRLSAEQTPDRPRQDTLLPGILSLADAKLQFDRDGDRRMGAAQVDPTWLRHQAVRITSGREIAGLLQDAAQVILRNVAVWEDEAHTVARDAYENVRVAAQKDDELQKALLPMELHIGDAAQRAAQRNAENRDLRKEAHSQGYAEGLKAGLSQVERLDKDAALKEASKAEPPARKTPR